MDARRNVLAANGSEWRCAAHTAVCAASEALSGRYCGSEKRTIREAFAGLAAMLSSRRCKRFRVGRFDVLHLGWCQFGEFLFAAPLRKRAAVLMEEAE